VNGFAIPFNGGSNTVLTDWFQVTNRTASTARPTPTATPSSTSGASSTATPAQDASHGDSKSLSGGAIAGIVIGVILAVALVVGAALFLRKRKQRETPRDREAAARAARLEPVMQEGYPGFEMHQVTSKA
jgi:uncharacterized protein HemX